MTDRQTGTCLRSRCGRQMHRAGLCQTHWRSSPHGYVDAAPALKHLARLRAAGLGERELVRLTGLSRRTLQNLGRWTEQGGTTLDTAQRILSVPVPNRIVDGGALLPALGTARRLQALMAMGWPQRVVAERTGVREGDLSRLKRNKYVTSRIAAAVAEVYEDLHMTPGPSEKCVQVAKAKGYLPPLAFDDIDDPNEKPSRGLRGTVPRAEVIAELQELGVTDVRELARRLGIEPESVQRVMLRSAA